MKVAVVFPGQGSQYVGMGKEFYDRFESAKEFFDKADEVLGFSLSRMIFEGPEDELKKTYNTQPALLTVSCAIYSVFKSKAGERLPPFALAGHSLGEYTALVIGEAIAFEDAVYLVRRRGELMQNAVPLGVGGMAAIMGLSGDDLFDICKEASAKGVVEPVNFNSPVQVVISGHMEAVKLAAELAKSKGARKVVMLPVSAPFHSSLMKPAAEELAKEIEKVDFKDSKIPIVANVTADYVTSAAQIKELLIQQMYKPVLWEDSVKKLVNDGVDTFFEVGAGKVLKGLIKKIDRRVNVLNVEDLDSLKSALEFLDGGM